MKIPAYGLVPDDLIDGEIVAVISTELPGNPIFEIKIDHPDFKVVYRSKEELIRADASNADLLTDEFIDSLLAAIEN